jgi:hypothetical protein
VYAAIMSVRKLLGPDTRLVADDPPVTLTLSTSAATPDALLRVGVDTHRLRAALAAQDLVTTLTIEAGIARLTVHE